MSKLIPEATKLRILLMRQKGYSYPEISRELHVGNGSIFRYAKGVKILPEYRKIWHEKQGGSIKRMLFREQIAKEKADNIIKSLSYNEKLILLTALYWGEGSKGDFCLMNSDSELIRVFIHILVNDLKISIYNIRISIRIYEDLDIQKCKEFWSKITGINSINFSNTEIIRGKKKGKLTYGMCRVRLLKGSDMLKYMKALRLKISSLIKPS